MFLVSIVILTIEHNDIHVSEIQDDKRVFQQVFSFGQPHDQSKRVSFGQSRVSEYELPLVEVRLNIKV